MRLSRYTCRITIDPQDATGATTMDVCGQQEVVMLFGAEESVERELLLADFEAIHAGHATLPAQAACQVRAAYCVVGNGLNLRGVVFFLFNVTEDGAIDASFNLPLRYLVQHAGLGCDLGQGRIRKACRGQCPVPWHAVNLWEPEAGDTTIEHLQSRIYRNKLKLKSVSPGADEDFFYPQDSELELLDDESLSNSGGSSGVGTSESSLPARATQRPPEEGLGEEALNARLNEVFGAAGKLSLQDLIRLHAEQLETAKHRYRQDIESQQSAYLEQLRTAKEEIHELKTELRHEQGRNRRLQQMLRGDI